MTKHSIRVCRSEAWAAYDTGARDASKGFATSPDGRSCTVAQPCCGSQPHPGVLRFHPATKPLLDGFTPIPRRPNMRAREISHE